MGIIKFGKKGISMNDFPMIMIGGIVLIGFVGLMMNEFEMSDAPTNYEDVLKYYNDMFSGKMPYGTDSSVIGLLMGFMVPLISSFSILWALFSVIPLFSKGDAKNATAVLAFGISLYAAPGMSWMLVKVFPNILGVSGMFIAIAILLASVGVIVSTTKLLKGSVSGKTASKAADSFLDYFRGSPKDDDDKGGEDFREEIRKHIEYLTDVLKEAKKVTDEGDSGLADTYIKSVGRAMDLTQDYIERVERSELQDWKKETDRVKLERYLPVLANQLKKLIGLKGSKFCPKCKAENKSEDEYCFKCGEPLTPSAATEKSKRGNNEKILDEYVEYGKKELDRINKIKKEELPEDLKKDAEELKNLVERLKKAKTYEDKVGIGKEMEKLFIKIKRRPEGKKPEEKSEEKEDDEKPVVKDDKYYAFTLWKEEFRRNIGSFEKLAREVNSSLDNLTRLVDEKRVCTEELRKKANKLRSKNTRLYKLAAEVKNLFRKDETLQNALKIYLAKGYFKEIRDASTDLLKEIKEFNTAVVEESNKKVKYKENGEEVEKTFKEASPRAYNDVFPKLLKKFDEYRKFILMRNSELNNLVQKASYYEGKEFKPK